jgi:hypothetical protein
MKKLGRLSVWQEKKAVWAGSPTAFFTGAGENAIGRKKTENRL